MTKLFLSVFYLTAVFTAQANIRAIKLENISDYELIKGDLNFVIEHDYYYNHWSPKWEYDISKKKALQYVKNIVNHLTPKTYDDFLLCGDLAHFQYNLAEEEQFKVAVMNYEKAIQLQNNNYLGYWFLANHYALSAVQDSSVFYFRKAESLHTAIENADFWGEYAFAFNLANMPSHTVKAMDNANRILGTACYMEKVLGKSIRGRLTPANVSATYELKDLWNYKEENEFATFISRPLGMRITIDSNWQCRFGGYKSSSSYIMMTPFAEKNKKGVDVTYTIAVLMHVAEKGETIDDYVNKLVGKYEDKKTDSRYAHLSPVVSYELKDPEMYPEWGGGHMQLMAFVKDAPAYPGYDLETPASLPTGKSKKPQFYVLKNGLSRFEGKIFYIIMLDTCDDIYDRSIISYEDFLSRLVIE